jgi:hypothetical protein
MFLASAHKDPFSNLDNDLQIPNLTSLQFLLSAKSN